MRPGKVGARAGVYGGEMRVENGRTREEVSEWLIGMAAETPRMVVGFDFCFSFPEWFVRGEHGCATGPEFWEVVTREHGERWLERGHGDRRFWGKPHKRPAEFSGENLQRMMRATDIDCKLDCAYTGGGAGGPGEGDYAEERVPDRREWECGDGFAARDAGGCYG